MARMRLQYDEARKEVHRIQQELADLEEKMSPGQTESDKDRLVQLDSLCMNLCLKTTEY